MKRIFYVYIAFRPWDGSPFYVGKGKEERWLRFAPSDRKNNKHLLNIILKAKKLDLNIPVVKVRDGLTESDAFEIERAFIAAIGRGKFGPLVNLTVGGDGVSGFRHSESTKARQSAVMKEKLSDPAARSVISKLTKEAMARPEIKANTSAAQTARFERPEEIKKAARRATGRKPSATTRATMSLSGTKSWADPAIRNKRVVGLQQNAAKSEYRASLREALAKPETKAQMKASAKARSTPEYCAHISAVVTQAMADPARRAKMAEYARLGAEARWGKRGI